MFLQKNCQSTDSRSAEFPCSNSVRLLPKERKNSAFGKNREFAIPTTKLRSPTTEGTQEFPPLNDFAALRQCELQTRGIMLPNSEIRQNGGSSGKPNRTKVGNPSEQDTISYLQIYIITLFYKPFIFA